MNEIKKLQKFIKSLEQSDVFDWVKKLKKEFLKAEVYLVGGAVRDACLPAFVPKKTINTPAGKFQSEIKDLDFVVRNVPLNKLQIFLSKLGWVEELGKSFGVLKFKPKGLSYKDDGFEALDIALPRKEFSTGQGGYRDFKVKFDKNLKIEDDLGRRDFTINAIAMRVDRVGTGRDLSDWLDSSRAVPTFELSPQDADNFIIDPFNGIADIKHKIIRCVGKPEQRLSEDYTRILRAVRLACQLNFEIDVKTKLAIKKLAKHLNDKDKNGDFIAVREVIAKEFLKAFLCDHIKVVELYDKLGLFKVLIPELLKMKKCPQPKNYHTEGDVWQHTMLALSAIGSAKFKSFENKLNKILETEKLKKQETKDVNGDKLELILAVLFHDIGKPSTIQTPKKDKVDRIRFNNHDNVGADLTRKICRALRFSVPIDVGVSPDKVAWLVRKHMMLVHGHPSEFKPTTIEKYFFNDKYPGKNLIKLAWLDSSATITSKGPLDFKLINALLKRIKEMKKLVNKKQAKRILPEPLLNGDEIMKILKCKPGRRVGEIKNKLREKQLSGEIGSKKQAVEVVRSLKK